jgi:hypothetical protein
MLPPGDGPQQTQEKRRRPRIRHNCASSPDTYSQNFEMSKQTASAAASYIVHTSSHPDAALIALADEYRAAKESDLLEAETR